MTQGGGLGNAMLGSLMMVFTASAFAIPVAVLAAVYLAEFRNDRLTGPVRFVTELLSGVPSIIIGVFAATLLVHPRSSGWAGVFALGIMMLPVLIRTSEEAMRLVPNPLREASYALGATQWQTVNAHDRPRCAAGDHHGNFVGHESYRRRNCSSFADRRQLAILAAIAF